MYVIIYTIGMTSLKRKKHEGISESWNVFGVSFSEKKSIFERERLNLVSKTLYDFMFIRWFLSFALSFRSVARNTIPRQKRGL